jgi:hypothetical protein
MKKKREIRWREYGGGEKGRGEMTEERRGKGEADQSQSRKVSLCPIRIILSVSPTTSRKADRRNW